MLTNRQKTLLHTLVEDFVESGVPVGSRTLMNKHQLAISSATIRAELKKLEEQGFIEKTHISSGRIPSIEGYKHYISTLQTEHATSEVSHENFDELADKLAADTHYFSIVTGFYKARKIEGIHLAAVAHSLLIILIYSDGEVEHEQLDWQSPLSMEELLELNQYFNAVIHHKNATYTPLNKQLVSMINHYVNRRLKKPEPVIYKAGQEFLFDVVPKDLDSVRDLLSYIESDSFISKLISMNDDLINVKIGQEIDDRLNHVSLVTKPVQTTKVDGRLAVIGPIMMSYRKVFEELSAL